MFDVSSEPDPNDRPDDLPWPTDAVAAIAAIRRRIARRAAKADK